MAWMKSTWKGNPCVYLGDDQNSVTFYGPQAEFYRDEYFDMMADRPRDSELERFKLENRWDYHATT